MCITVFLYLKSKLALQYLQTFESLTVHFVARLWGNRYSHVLLVGVKNGTIPMEGDLVIVTTLQLQESVLIYFQRHINTNTQGYSFVSTGVCIYNITFICHKYCAKHKYHQVVLFVIKKPLDTTSMSKHGKEKLWYSHTVEHHGCCKPE